jgi:hypothetical protein
MSSTPLWAGSRHKQCWRRLQMWKHAQSIQVEPSNLNIIRMYLPLIAQARTKRRRRPVDTR